MGLEPHYIDWMENITTQHYGPERNGLFMFELGNQELCHPIREDLVGRTGKSHYTSLGYRHISVDTNGHDGALPLDLRNEELFKEWYGTVDVLTNSGTTEHVEPHSAQYTTFGILHNLVKVGGLMFHIVPEVTWLDNHGVWKGHCTNYYTEDFFHMLGEQNDYQLIDLTYMNIPNWSLIAVAYRKQTEQPFMEDRELFLSKIALRQ